MYTISHMFGSMFSAHSISDVRRAILYNLNATTVNYPYLLERSRDVDAPTRRAVYTRLLPAMGDFRQLQISMREKLLRWGLNDRDLSVREAARRMFSYKWIEDAKGDILEVLERLDILNEPLEGGPKSLAMKSFWEQRKDVLNNIEFDKEFWENITPEGSFLARSFNDYCRNTSPQEAKGLEVDERMPEVARLTDYLEHHIDKLVAATKGGFEEEQDQEFVVQQMLLIAQTMDYGDEIGRRKLFALLREKLAVLELSEPVTKLIVEGLRKLSMGETDFCMLTLEVIAELHDTVAEDYEEGADESHHSTGGDDSDDIQDSITVQPRSAQKPNGRPSTPAELPTPKKRKTKRESSGDDDDTMMDIDEDVSREEDEEDEDAEKVIKELMVNMKCLHIAQCMLENVDGWMKPNSHLVTMLNGLIVPAVRSHEAPVRERGLHCLGLSCLLDRVSSPTFGLHPSC
jgi:condensin complex subunit 3